MFPIAIPCSPRSNDMDPIDDAVLQKYIDITYEAESHFFPEGGTQTYSGDTYDLVVALGMAVRDLVSYIRKQQGN